MVYKTLKKVSNVCQLVDKSNYPATGTRDGVTWTNNGDGTITANGTTNEVYYTNYIISMPQFKEVKNDHKYVLFSGINDINVAFVECICYLGGQDGSYFVKNCVETNIAGTFGFTIPQGEYPLWQRVELRVRSGYTANDLTFKPQLFDLTEMYGAGHEPTTVEQFRQDFPEEMYDYRPYCFVNSYKTMLKATDDKIITSYKKSLICKTKNLFNPLGREDANPTGNWPITKYDVGNVIYRGFAYSGYYQQDESYKCDVSVSGAVINVVEKIINYGIGYIVKCNPDTVYTLSYETNFNVIVSIFLDLEGNKLGDSWSRTFTTPNNAYYLLVSFASTTAGTYFIKNLQLELGDTATEYHPYGYL